jgi:2-iminobutanoate/2-iminopropanoate deaminase
MNKKIFTTAKAPAPIGPYNQAVAANGFLFVSGQICINPDTGELSNTDISTEAHQVMRNIEAILAEAGINLQHVVKTTIFLSDMNLFAQVNDIYGSYFAADYPARETVAVKGLPKNVNVEISVTAVM